MRILQVLPKLQLKKNFDWLAATTHLPTRGIIALRYMLSGKKNNDMAAVSKEITDNIVPEKNSFRNMSFTFAAISLSAMVARADGRVSREEYLAFRDSFPLTGGMCGKIRQLFLLACQSQTPLSSHILQIKILFPQQIELYTSLLDRLFRIATADKPLVKEEERLLAKIAHSLGLSPNEYSALHDRYSRPLAAHAVLGIEKRSQKNLIKQKYHTLMNRYHPDRYASAQTSPEVQMLLTLKSAEISHAYRKLVRKSVLP